MMAAGVLGASVIRGKVTPVVDARILLSSGGDSPPARLVVLRVGERAVALAVDAILGLQRIEDSDLRALPPLLGGADAGVVIEIGRLDADLIVVLDSARLVPESVWCALDAKSKAR
jgi:purine-binding chemotaxis protein CheW